MAGHLAIARAGGGDAGGSFVRVPVRYDGEDIAAVCEATGLARHELIDLHSGRDYRVFAVGASPGFPFLGVLDERLRMARHPTPRSVVPAHSVAMTGLQTGIYPVAGPGRLAVARTRAARGLRPVARAAVPDRARATRCASSPRRARCRPTPAARPLLPVRARAPGAARGRGRPARPRRRRRPPHGGPLRHGAVGPGGCARGAPGQRARRERPLRAAARADRAGPAADRSAARAHRRHGARRPALDRRPAGRGPGDARPRRGRSHLAAAHRAGSALVPRDRRRDRERALHGQREHRRARPRRACRSRPATSSGRPGRSSPSAA